MKNSTLILMFLLVAGLTLSAKAERALVDDSTGRTVSTTPSSQRGSDQDSDVDDYFPKQKQKAQRKTAKQKREVDADADESAAGSSEVHQPYKEADDGMTLRILRRVGIGLQAAGALGLGGAILDMNFAPQWSTTVGYGGGGGFQAFEIQGKYVLSGTWIMPYASFGYARWSSTANSGPITSTNPSLLGDRLLNDSEKASGQFTKNIFYPALGIQYTQLHGEWTGTSIYAELTVLLDIGNAVAAPTGALGMAYYF